MAVRQDKVQVDVEINGKGAGQTLEQLEKESRQLVRELRKMDPATEDFAKKAEKLKAVQGNVKEIKTEMFGVQQATGGAKDSFEAMNPYQEKFAQLGNTIGGIKGKVMSVWQSMKTLNGLLMTSAIGLVVGLLALLVNYLTSTQAGMDKVTSVTRPLMAIFERLKGVLQELGGKLFKQLGEAINNPKQALTDLADIIKNNVIKRFEAFGVMGKSIVKIFSKDWKEGFAELGNGYLQAVTGVEDVAGKVKNAIKGASDWVKEGIDLGTQMDQLHKQIERDEIEMIKRRSELQKIAKEQNFIVEDETKTFDQRRKAAEAALKAQEELQQIQIALLDKRIKLMDLEHSQNDTSRENEKEMAELVAQREEIIASVTEMRTTTRNKLNILNKGEAADYQKMLDEKRKAEEEYAKKVASAEEALTDLKISMMTDETERAIAEINRRFEKEKAAFEGSEQQMLEFQKLKEQEKAAEITKLKQEERLKEYDELLKLEDELTEMDRLRIEEKLLTALITDEEAKQAELDRERAHMESRLALMAEQYGMESQQYQLQKNALLAFDKQRVDEQIENEKRLQAAKEDITMAGTAALGDLVGTTLDLLSQEEAGRKKFGRAIQAFEIAKIGANLAAEISAIWKNASSNPSNILFPGFAQIIAGVQTGAAVARATLAANKVNSMKFALGDIVRGPSHNQGGIAMFDRRSGKEIGEMEGDEIILTKGVSRDPLLRAAASRINVLGGGRMFEAGGPVNPYRETAEVPGTAADATMASPIGSSQSGASEMSMTAVVAEIRALRADINNMNTRLKAYVVYSDIEDAETEVSQVRSDATLG